jgi:hypothetical protein
MADPPGKSVAFDGAAGTANISGGVSILNALHR